MYAQLMEASLTQVRTSNRHECSLRAVRERVSKEHLVVFDRLEVTFGRKIGEGGQAVIYEATWCSLLSSTPLHVVVKKFKPYVGISQGHYPLELWTHRFQFVCKPHGVLFDDESLCVVLPWFAGDLRTAIDTHLRLRREEGHGEVSPFSELNAISYITQIAFGMKGLHDGGIPHKDLKAANILVEGVRPKYYAKLPTTNIAIADIENSDDVIGTGFWRAPEVLQKRVIDGKELTTDEWKAADVYSFAMTCYEILTGKDPFDGHPLSDYTLVLSKKRPDIPVHVPEPLRNIIRRCWHHNPLRRPSFAEIILLLNKLQSPAIHLVHLAHSMRVASDWKVSANLDSPFDELLQDLKQSLLKLVADHGLDSTNRSCHAFWYTEFIATVEQYDSKFGRDSCHLQRTSLPFSKYVERLRLITLVEHHFLAAYAVIEANKEQDLQCRELSFFFEMMDLHAKGSRILNTIWPNWVDTYHLREDDDALLLDDKLLIVQDFILSMNFMEVPRWKVSRIVGGILNGINQLERSKNQGWQGIGIGRHFKLVFLLYGFHPFYIDKLMRLTGITFSFKTVILYLAYRISGCSDIVFRYTGYKILGFQEVFLGYLAWRMHEVFGPIFTSYISWKGGNYRLIFLSILFQIIVDVSTKVRRRARSA